MYKPIIKSGMMNKNLIRERIMQAQKTIDVNEFGLQEGNDFINEKLKEIDMDDFKKAKAQMLAEEVLKKLEEHTSFLGEINIEFKEFMGRPYIKIYSDGREFDLIEEDDFNSMLFPELKEETANIVIRDKILCKNKDQIKFVRRGDQNNIIIFFDKPGRALKMFPWL